MSTPAEIKRFRTMDLVFGDGNKSFINRTGYDKFLVKDLGSDEGTTVKTIEAPAPKGPKLPFHPQPKERSKVSTTPSHKEKLPTTPLE